MRKIILIMLLIVLIMMCGDFLTAGLLEVYKKGEIRLIADPEFGKNVDWKTLFIDSDKSPGHLKDLAISDDGSIFISNRSQLNIFKFDSKGNFIKKFAEKGRRTAPSSPKNRRPDSVSILDNKYVVVHEYQGRIVLYDLEGNFVKLMKMEYPVKDCIALKNNKIAITGFVLYSNGRSKKLVAVKDVLTEKEKHITFFMEEHSKTAFSYKKNGGMYSISIPFSSVKTYIRRSNEGNLVVGFSNSSKITIYSPEGGIIKSFDTSIRPLKIPEEVRQQYLERINKLIKKHNLAVEPFNGTKAKPDFIPGYLPHYYHVIVDGEGNLLVFIYTSTEVEKRPVFKVYSPRGIYVCDVVINPGEYKVSLKPGLRSMAFFEGDIYGLFELKEAVDVPFRLIRVKLSK